MLKSVFVLQKLANSLPIGHHQKRLNSPLRLAAGPAGGAHTSDPPGLRAGSRERAPKGRGEVREGDEGKG